MFVIRLADVCIGIDNTFELVHRQCKNYIADEEPAFTVKIGDDERRREAETSTEEVKKKIKDLDGYAESVCVYRNICRILPSYGAFLFHSAALSYRGEGYLFSAPSGTGKTTHLRLWMRMLKGEPQIVNGDKPILKKTDGGFVVCGTPWSGKEGWQNNVCAPVRAVCFLERSKENRIERMSDGEAAQALFAQLVYPRDPANLSAMLTLADGFVKSARFYRLHCNVSEEAARLSFETMTGLPELPDGGENFFEKNKKST